MQNINIQGRSFAFFISFAISSLCLISSYGQNPYLSCDEAYFLESWFYNECEQFDGNIKTTVDLRRIGEAEFNYSCAGPANYELVIQLDYAETTSKSDILNFLSESDTYAKYYLVYDVVKSEHPPEESIIYADYFNSTTGHYNRHYLDLIKLVDDYYEEDFCQSGQNTITFHVPFTMTYILSPAVESYLNSSDGLGQVQGRLELFMDVFSCGNLEKTESIGRGVGNSGRWEVGEDNTTTLLSDEFLIYAPDGSIIDGTMPEPNPACSNEPLSRRVFKGTFIIDQDYCFLGNNLQNRPDVYLDNYMNPNARIVVPDGITLEMNQISLRSCGKDAGHAGILVESGGTLILNNVVIGDALTAVEAEGGATIILNDVNFLNNRIALSLHGQQATNLGSNSVISNCVVESDVYSKVGWHRGFKLNNMNELNCDILQCSFVNLENALELHNDSKARVVECNFENISGNNLISGGTVHLTNSSNVEIIGLGGEPGDPPTFINCPRLITGVQNRNISMIECKSEDARVGVETWFGRSSIYHLENNSIIADEEAVKHQYLRGGLHIFNNNDFIASGNNLQATVNMSSNLSRPIISMENNYVKADGNIGAGLKVNETNMAWYFENTFDASSSAFVGVDGSKVEQSGWSTFNCNSFIGKGQGGASQHGLDASSVNGRINCNVFTNNDHGFHSNASCSIDLASNTFGNGEHGLYLSRETEISPQTHRGNVWNGSYSGTHGAFNANIDRRIIENSQFTVDESANDDYLPDWWTGIDQNAPWFVDELGSDDEPGCAADCDPGSANRSELYNSLDEKSDYFLKYMMPNTDGDILPGTYVNVRQMLFEQLSILDQRPADYEPFYQAYPATDEGQLYLAQESLDALYSADDYTLAQVDWSDAQQTALLFQQITDNTIAADDPALTNIATTISSIPATSDQTTHVKDMLLIKMKLLQNPDYQISTQELAQIDVLANGCPMIDGYGVYMARSLARPLLDQEYDNEISCLNITDRQANRSEERLNVKQLRVAPNPAMQQVTISLPDWVEGKNLQIMNAYGILHQSMSPQRDRVVLDISDWQAGIYYAHYGRHSARIVKVSE